MLEKPESLHLKGLGAVQIAGTSGIFAFNQAVIDRRAPRIIANFISIVGGTVAPHDEVGRARAADAASACAVHRAAVETAASGALARCLRRINRRRKKKTLIQ